MVIVLLHCSTFRVVLNVALSSPKGLSFPLSQTTDIYVERDVSNATPLFAILNDHATQTVPTPVALRRMLSRVPTPIALRRVHWYWFRFQHTRVWVWALCWVEVL